MKYRIVLEKDAVDEITTSKVELSNDGDTILKRVNRMIALARVRKANKATKVKKGKVKKINQVK